MLTESFGRLRRGEHLCSVYDSREDNAAVVVSFLRLGLDRGERCLYVSDDVSEESSRDVMQAAGIDVARTLETRALLLMTADQVYLPRGSFDPDGALAFWREASARAIAEGFSGLRAVCDVTGPLRAGLSLERWMGYEHRLTPALAESGATIICSYDRRELPAEIMRDAVRAHPMIAHAGILGRNTFYIPREGPQSPDAVGREVERMLYEVKEHAQLVSSHGDEAKFRRTVAYLTLGQQITHTGSWAWNPRSGSLFWSAEHFRIFGLDPQRSRASRELFSRMVHHEERENVEKTFQHAVRSGQVYDLEYRIVRADGALRYIHSVAQPSFVHEGEVAEYVGTIVDVTEERLAEEELRRAQAERTQIARMLTVARLATSIAHEVSQPLAAVVANANAGLRWLAPRHVRIGRAREAFARIVSDGNRASEVIARIRRLVKGARVDRELFDVNRLVRELSLLMRAEVRRHDVVLLTEIAADLPRVPGDRVLLLQVLLNLVMNGIEAMEGLAGARELLITAHADAHQLLIAVRDSGVGLDLGDLERVFEDFYTTKLRGMGTGLSISRALVEEHGGRMWATRNDGPGATFQFTLPLR